MTYQDWLETYGTCFHKEQYFTKRVAFIGGIVHKLHTKEISNVCPQRTVVLQLTSSVHSRSSVQIK